MYFAVTETAMASVSRTRIKTAAERGDARAKNALFLLDNFDRAITTILIGTNIVHIAVASIVTVAVTRRWGLSVVTLSTIVTTIAVFFLGEMLPKSLGKEYSEKLLLSCAGPMRRGEALQGRPGDHGHRGRAVRYHRGHDRGRQP